MEGFSLCLLIPGPCVNLKWIIKKEVGNSFQIYLFPCPLSQEGCPRDIPLSLMLSGPQMLSWLSLRQLTMLPGELAV